MARIRRDPNRMPIQGLLPFLEVKTVAFSGAAGNGAVGSVALFTVTGAVALYIVGVCSEDLAGATATLEVGVSGNTAALIAQTTATDIDVGESWVDNAPATVETLATSPKIIGGGQDIIATVATANITDGTIAFYCWYEPMSSDGDVTAA